MEEETDWEKCEERMLVWLELLLELVVLLISFGMIIFVEVY